MNEAVRAPTPRRIVTGHDAQGRSTITADGPTPVSIQPDAQRRLRFHEIWRDGPYPADNANACDGALLPFALDPGPHGLLCRIVDIPPDAEMGWNGASASDIFTRIGGEQALSAQPQRHAAFHRTDTLDIVTVIDGEVWALTEDGEVLLAPGDVLVQRGTQHAWSNRSGGVARVFATMVGARPLAADVGAGA